MTARKTSEAQWLAHEWKPRSWQEVEQAESGGVPGPVLGDGGPANDWQRGHVFQGAIVNRVNAKREEAVR